MTQNFFDYLQTQLDSLDNRDSWVVDAKKHMPATFSDTYINDIKNLITDNFIELCRIGIINSDKIQEFKDDFEECGVFFNKEHFGERACVYFDRHDDVSVFNSDKVYIKNASGVYLSDVGLAFVERAKSVSAFEESHAHIMSANFVFASDSFVTCFDVKQVVGSGRSEIMCHGDNSCVSGIDHCYIRAKGHCVVALSDSACGVVEGNARVSCSDNSLCHLSQYASAFLYGGCVKLEKGANSSCYNLLGDFSVSAEKQNTLIMERSGMESVLHIKGDHFEDSIPFYIKAKYLGDWLDGKFKVSCAANYIIIGENNFSRREFLSLLNKRTSNITLFAGLYDERIRAFNKAVNLNVYNHISISYKHGSQQGFYICGQINSQKTAEVKISREDYKKVRDGCCTKQVLADKYLKSEIEKLLPKSHSQDISRGLKL